jgi:predicted Zn-dependent protease
LAKERGDEDDGPARTSFLASHPASPERSEETRKNAPKLTIADEAPLAKDQAAFLGRLEGIVIGTLAIEGVFVEEHFLQPEMDFGIRMPVGWDYMNSDRAVIAQTPDKDAMVVLEVAGEGGDPLATAHDQAKKSKVKIEPRATTINGLDAVEASVVIGGRGDRKGLQLTWIASGDLVYQITGIAKIDRFDGLKPTFEGVGRSFQTLSADDRKLIHENRLRVARAKEGETFEELSKRADSAWSADQCAVANALDIDAKLAEGLLIKIAHPERYEP